MILPLYGDQNFAANYLGIRATLDDVDTGSAISVADLIERRVFPKPDALFNDGNGGKHQPLWLFETIHAFGVQAGYLNPQTVSLDPARFKRRPN